MTITNINYGVCQARLQQNLPSFFANWQEDGHNKYKFFKQRWQLESQLRYLKELQTQENKPQTPKGGKEPQTPKGGLI